VFRIMKYKGIKFLCSYEVQLLQKLPYKIQLGHLFMQIWRDRTSCSSVTTQRKLCK